MDTSDSTAGPSGWELKNTTDEPGYAKADAEHPDPPQDPVDLGLGSAEDTDGGDVS